MRDSFLEKAIEDVLDMSNSRSLEVKIYVFLKDIRVELGDSELYLRGVGFEVPERDKPGLSVEREDLMRFVREDLWRNVEREPLLRYPGSESVTKVIFPPCEFEVRRLIWVKECRYLFSRLSWERGYYEVGKVTFSSRWIVSFVKGWIGTDSLSIVYLGEPNPVVFNTISNFWLRIVAFRGFIRALRN